MPRSTPPLPGCRSTPPLPGSSASFKADVVIERRQLQEETAEGKCEIESDDHVIVCVEAASASSEDTEAVHEGTEAEEAEEEVEGGERDTCSPPSPCHVLDGHFDALTALANEGRNGAAIAFSPFQSLVAQLFKMLMIFSFCLVVKLFHLKRNTRHQLIHATFLSIKSL